MNDAAAALDAALSELHRVKGAFPSDLDEEVQDVIRRAVDVLESLRSAGDQNRA